MAASGHVRSELPASLFHDGTLLTQLAQEFVEDFAATSSDGGLAHIGNRMELEISVGTICSGSEIVLFVLRAISEAYQKQNICLKFIHVFSCEIKASVQNWIKSLKEELEINEGCLFEKSRAHGAGICMV